MATRKKPSTKLIEYVGDHGPVSLPQDGEADLVFAPGEPREVEAELADRLLQQDTFLEVAGGEE